MRPANERWRYTVTPSLIDWEHAQNDPSLYKHILAFLENTLYQPAFVNILTLWSLGDLNKILDKLLSN